MTNQYDCRHEEKQYALSIPLRSRVVSHLLRADSQERSVPMASRIALLKVDPAYVPNRPSIHGLTVKDPSVVRYGDPGNEAVRLPLTPEFRASHCHQDQQSQVTQLRRQGRRSTGSGTFHPSP